MRSEDGRILSKYSLIWRELNPGLGDLLEKHAVAVTIAHEGIGRMAALHRRDAVAPCLGTGDPAVAVVVPEAERIDIAR